MQKREGRVERDLLGEKWLPTHVYYGIQTQRAVENFPITGLSIHPELIRSLAIVKKAAALANVRVGKMDKKIGEAIVKAADDVINGKLMDQFVVDPIQGGAGTSINMNMNEVLANRASEYLHKEKGDYQTISPNTHVNMSQSTNDVLPTAIHITVLNLSQPLLTELEQLIKVLHQKEKEFAHVIKMGRTHLQDAVPIRLGQEFGAYAKVITRDLQRIESALEKFYEINIGATAVGTGLNADPQYVQNVIKLLIEFTHYPLKQADNLVDATQNVDEYTELSSMLKILAINLSKIANDLRLMSSGPRTGLNEINLPQRQPGSSIMPGKVNPVICEVVNQVSFQVIGNDHTISMAAEAGQLELNVMVPVIVFNLLQSITTLTNSIHVFTQYAVKGITANVERCRKMVEESVGIVTAINPYVGYENASKIAKEALIKGKRIYDVCLEKGLLPREVLDEILDIDKIASPSHSKH